MSLYKTFKTNKTVEQGGLVVGYGNNSKGKPIEIRLARAGGSNVAFLSRYEILTKPHRRIMQMDTKPDGFRDVMDGVMRQVYAETVIKDWQGVEDENGQDLEFNVDNVMKLLKDLPDLFNDIIEQANNSALFRDEIRAADAKN